MSLIVQCSVCGEKFDDGIKFCPGCGAARKYFRAIETENSSEVKVIDSVIEKKDTSGKSKSKEKLDSFVKTKSLSAVKLVYFIIFLFLIGSLVVYSSGIFDSPAFVNSTTKIEDPHAGVDLTSLQQINELEKKVESNPKDFTSLLSLAHLLNDSGFKEKAIKRYQEYLTENSNAADVWVDMGVCYFELGKNEDAVQNMEKAIKIEPKHQIAHLNLGIVNFSMGNQQKAKEYWQKAISINPANEIAKRAEELIHQH